MAIIGIMATGMVFVIVTGGIDLSVGYGSGFVSVVAAALLYYGLADEWITAVLPFLGVHSHDVVTAGLVVVLGLVLGMLMGAFQGSIISRLSVPPFIVTLGGFSIFKSGILIVTQGKSLFITSYETYKYLAQGLIPAHRRVRHRRAGDGRALRPRVHHAGTQAKSRRAMPARSRSTSLRAGIFSVLVIGYVLIVNRTFERKPQAQAAAAADDSSAGTFDVGKMDLDESTSQGTLKNFGGGDDTSKVGASTPDALKIEAAPEEQADTEVFTPPTGIPVLVVILGIVALLMSYVSQNTRFGRYTYAVRRQPRGGPALRHRHEEPDLQGLRADGPPDGRLGRRARRLRRLGHHQRRPGLRAGRDRQLHPGRHLDPGRRGHGVRGDRRARSSCSRSATACR